MPIMDSTAKAALALQVVVPIFYIWLDISGDQIRVTNYKTDVTFSGSGDSELDGTYSSVDARMLRVGDVSQSNGGSDTLLVELSGIASIDTTLLNEIGNRSLWQGRTIRLWYRIYDENDAAQGAVVAYYTGFMSSVEIIPSAEQQIIRMKIENYLSSMNDASNRTYLNQSFYDASDASAAATISAANGARHHNLGSREGNQTPGGGGFFGIGQQIFDHLITNTP